jgi:5-methylcytosine-specific restriction endonuclease McrA
MPRRTYLTAHWRKHLRPAILARDAYTCHWCGARATQVDHIRALAEGGEPYNPSNLVAACASCNAKRGNKTRQNLTKTSLFKHGGERLPALTVRGYSQRFQSETVRLGAIRV